MMRRRRIRSSRQKKSGGGWNILIFLLLVAVVAVYAWLALNREEVPGPAGITALPSAAATTGTLSPAPTGGTAEPGATAANTGKITETITLKSVTLYSVQLGVFSDQANATTAADGFRAKGAAGYILKEKEGGMYRVLDSVYYQENDAKAARDAYKTADADSACLFNVETAGIQWNVSGTREQIDAIKAAVNTFQSEIIKLINVQKQAAQAGSSDTAEAVAAVRSAADGFTAANAALTKAVGNTKVPVIKSLSECLAESAANLNKLADSDSANIVEFLSGLKYNVIDILLMLENRIMNNE